MRACCMQEAACRLGKPEPVAANIGAVNTLVRNSDGSMAGHNTDWKAALDAIEEELRASPFLLCFTICFFGRCKLGVRRAPAFARASAPHAAPARMHASARR